MTNAILIFVSGFLIGWAIWIPIAWVNMRKWKEQGHTTIIIDEDGTLLDAYPTRKVVDHEADNHTEDQEGSPEIYH